MSGKRVAFTGGEWNRMGDIRCDVDGYERSAREVVNFFVHGFGGLMRRPGAERMCVVSGLVNGGEEGKAGVGKVRLMGMDVSDERRYVVVFGAGFVEVRRLDGSLAARLVSPWVEGDLQGLRWVQCNDVVWVVCSRVAPQRLERHGDADWRLVEMVFDRSPREYMISRDGEAWVERDAEGFTMGCGKDVFGEEDVGGSVLYTQHVPERAVKALPAGTVLGGVFPPKVCPDLSVAGTQLAMGQEVWTMDGSLRVLWTCFGSFVGSRDFHGGKSPADYPDRFFRGWVVSRFGAGSGYNSLIESRSGDGVLRAFLCHEGPWALTTYGDENQQWEGRFQLLAADAEADDLDPQRFEVLHSFDSWNGSFRNYSFSGDFKRAKRVQLRVLSYAPSGRPWGGHELRLNAWDYDAEGTVERVGRYDGEPWGAVVELGDGKVLLAANEQNRCYVFDAASGVMVGVGEERVGGCGWVGGCVLGDGRVFLAAGNRRCCVLDVETGEEKAVLLPEFVGGDFFGGVGLLPDGRVLLTPYQATGFYAYDVVRDVLEKLVHAGAAVTRGMWRYAVVLKDGRVLMCPCRVDAVFAVFDGAALTLTAVARSSAMVGGVWGSVVLRNGRVVLVGSADGGVPGDSCRLLLFVPKSDAGRTDDAVSVLSAFDARGVFGVAERDDGMVLVCESFFGMSLLDTESRSRVWLGSVVWGGMPGMVKWGRWLDEEGEGDGSGDGRLVMVNGLSGEPYGWSLAGGVSRLGVDAMRYRVARLHYKSYGGPGLPYDRAVTEVWSKGMFGGSRGWPGAVAMHQGRLWLAGTLANPQTVWGSVVDDFASFRMGDGDDDAVQVTMAAKDRHRVVWMESVNDLLVGSTAQVWRLSGGEGGVVTPGFCRASVQLRVGSSAVDAETTDGGCVFVQRGGMRVKELGYSFEADGYKAADTTTFAEHVGGPGGFVGLAVQRVPEVRIWGVRADGGLAVLTYNAEQRVCAWTRHVLGGGGRVLSAAVMDGVDADEVWLAVERDGVVSLERMVEGCGVFRDGWSRDGVAGESYESVLVSNELAFDEGLGVKHGGVSVRARFAASGAEGVRLGFNGRLTELSRSRGDVLDGWQSLSVPGVWSDGLVFELRCCGDGDVRFLGMDVQFSM